jgi:Protein of unknown function (DUF2846)
MFRRGVALSLAAVLLGCAGERIGADYAGLVQNVGPPKPGQSRIVLLTEKSKGLGLDAVVCDVKLDDGPTSRLKPRTYVYVDRPAGQHKLVVTEALFPGDTKRDITTQSGRTYFFLAKASARANTVTGMALAGGLAGVLVASAATSGSDNLGAGRPFSVG